MIEDDRVEINHLGVQILAAAGRQMAKVERQALEGLVPSLEGVCQSGNPKAAKHALRYIVSTSSTGI